MKVNRTNSIAKKAMRKKGDTSNRPEEKLACNIIALHLPKIIQIESQKIIWFNDINYAKLDIHFVISSGQKYAIRLNGPPHDGLKAQRHDRRQQIYLEERGYIVIDFWYNKMEKLFLRYERLLTDEELKEAYFEIKNILNKFGLHLRSLKLNNNDLQVRSKLT